MLWNDDRIPMIQCVDSDFVCLFVLCFMEFQNWYDKIENFVDYEVEWWAVHMGAKYGGSRLWIDSQMKFIGKQFKIRFEKINQILK